MPSTLNTVREAHTSGELSCELAVRSRFPKPSFEPMNSPMTAPMTDRVTAILAPEKIDGSADGSWILKKVWRRVHCSERASSRRSGDVERKPVAVSTTTGKKAITKAMANFD